MKNVEIRKMNAEQRLSMVKTMVNEKMRWVVEDIVDCSLNNKDYYQISIRLVKRWIKIYNNMRIMRGYTQLDGYDYYWHCLD